MNNKRILYWLIPVVIITSCSKTNVTPPGTASISIINSVVGANSLLVNFGEQAPGNYYLNAKQLLYNTFQSDYEFNAYSGTQKFTFYNYPDTLPSNTPVFNLTLNLPVGSINSLFVTGTLSSPDTLLVRDLPPNHPASDSSMGIRFVNLSPGSAPVNVNIQGQTIGSEVSSISYKSITGFKKYAATAAIDSYTFEFRDAATGTILGSYTMSDVNNDGSDPNNPVNLWRYRNLTLALLGLPAGTGADAQTILLINNF